ncbi:hypothetical protein [Blastochloris tepida]|uniref:Phage tail protein n=1 Tax=Blastochloris tepida TaxID=2233851 RepID=A0A348FYG9_9HYPH|nr:hypothetical protein [Blastochloris tepida]BBF92352.1 hypothetical protein BLTE_10370 [Blastochloris tepida]
MARRSEAYAVERGANLADPEYWNRRFEDIDLRLHARELDAATLQAAVETFQSLALARVNDTLTPILQDALTRLSSVGALFEADSVSPVPVGTGARTVQLLDAQRAAWVVTSHVVLRSRGSGAAMVAEVLAYERPSGLLTVDVLSAVGAGTHADWTIRLSAPPDIEHAGRTDNPHQTTADQVGAYTTSEADAAIASAIGALSASVATALAGKQAASANLAAFAGLSGAENGLPYFTGAGALALATLSAAARTLLAATDQTGQRSALGLGGAALLAAGTAAGNLVQLDAAGRLPALDGRNLTNLSASSVSSLNAIRQPDIIVQHQAASGTHGGTATTGARQLRPLNTVVRNAIGATLASNLLSLPAGSYFAEWAVQIYRVNACRSWLVNTTDGVDLGQSINGYSTTDCPEVSQGTAVFELAATKTIGVQQQVSGAAGTSYGMGLAASLGTELYATLKIWRL